MPVLKRGQRHLVTIILNGETRSGWAEPRTHLADFLRHELGALGTHVGCEHGICGACTVRVDGKAVRSCLILAVQAEGLRVDTVEGLAERAKLSPLQDSFRRNHALQCGFCTPGILMSLSEFQERHPQADEAATRHALSGHLCRCTGYTNIVRAALDAAPATEKGEAKE